MKWVLPLLCMQGSLAGRTTLCAAPNGLSSWLLCTAFGTPLPCIVTSLGNHTSMQTISFLANLEHRVLEPKDQKLTGRPSFVQRNTQFLLSVLHWAHPWLLVDWILESHTESLVSLGTLSWHHQYNLLWGRAKTTSFIMAYQQQHVHREGTLAPSFQRRQKLGGQADVTTTGS